MFHVCENILYKVPYELHIPFVIMSSLFVLTFMFIVFTRDTIRPLSKAFWILQFFIFSLYLLNMNMIIENEFICIGSRIFCDKFCKSREQTINNKYSKIFCQNKNKIS